MPPRLVGCVALFATALCFIAGSVAAFEATVLESVVSVLPRWPGYDGGRVPSSHADEPEGTAVVVRAGGFLVTAHHVVDRADRIMVRLRSGLRQPAKLVGSDRATDLALIRIETDLPVLPVGPEPALGAPVCAVGNQFGLGLSVTCGVVSAVRRSGVGFNAIEDFVQTDAVVNPGASGGALVDEEGRLVGVLSAIFTKDSDADIGINFAVSTRLMDRVVDDLISGGEVEWVAPGFALIDLQPSERRELSGARVLEVEPSSAAEQAGLRQGDVVTRVDDRAVRGVDDAMAAWHLHRAGESVALIVRRGAGTLELAVPVP